MLNYFINKRKRGQSTLEYAILIIIILGALLSVQVYIKRGIQGRLKQASDDIGEQYSDGNTNYYHYHHVASNTTDTFVNGESKTTLRGDETTTEIFNVKILNTEQEFWGK